MNGLLSDFRQSLRSLIRTPALTLTILLTVGLGIGAATMIFSAVHKVLLEPLPYPDSDEIFRIFTDSPPNRWPLSVVDYQALVAQQTSFSSVAGYSNTVMTFTDDERAESLAGKSVTWTYFSLLGIPPFKGRLFQESDDQPGAEPSVVISHRFWSGMLSADPGAVGRTIRLDGTPFRIVGILPDSPGPLEVDRDFFVAARWQPPTRKGPFFITALGRLRPDVQEIAAQEELRAINRQLFPIWQSSYQDQSASWGILILKSQLIGDVATRLWVVFGAVGFLLIIATANATNLQVARVTRRKRELAVRSALGASRTRLFGHLLAESTLLASGAAIVGWMIASTGVALLASRASAYLPRTSEIRFDGMSFAFLLVVTIASALLFTVVPILQAVRSHLEGELHSGGRLATHSPRVRRLRWALVTLQFAVAVPLLTGAGLLLASLIKLQDVEPGFEPKNLLTLGITLPRSNYSERGQVMSFWEELSTRVSGLPSVSDVAYADGRPPYAEMINNFDLQDRPTPAGELQPTSPWVAVTPEFFGVLQIPLLKGRLLQATDRDDSPPVVVVDQAWEKRYFPDGSALGRQFFSGGQTSGPRTTVVGVVGNVKYMGLDSPDQGTIYWPMLSDTFRSRYLLIRSTQSTAALIPALRTIVRELDPGLPLAKIETAEELLSASLQTPSYLTVVVTGFAISALILTVIGIYGVMAYFVQEHRRDIGIRLALGSLPSNILLMVVGRGLGLAALGLLIGGAGTLAFSGSLSSLLFEIEADDPGVLAGAVALVLCVALAACALPAIRAARIDPAKVLREE